jgi:hypothetical protein
MESILLIGFVQILELPLQILQGFCILDLQPSSQIR